MRLPTPRRTSLLTVAIAIALASPAAAQAVGTAFTYQGRLTDTGLPATGTYDFEFRLFDDETGGSQLGATVTSTGVPVQAGLFTTHLDFGLGPFIGHKRWLEIAVKAPAAGAYTVLTPRHELTAAPNALWAARAGQAATADKAGEAASVKGASLIAPPWSGTVGINTPNPTGAGLVVSGERLDVRAYDFEDGTLDPFTTSGSAPWTITEGPDIGDYSGTHSIRGGAVAGGNPSTSTLTLSFNASVPARISYALWTFLPDILNTLDVYVDGEHRDRYDNVFHDGWRRMFYNVGPGSHTITWQYTSYFVSSGVYIDDVRIELSTPALVAMDSVGIGTANPLDLLHVAGDARVGAGTTGCVKDADGTVVAGTCSSDARFKANVEPFPPMLDRVAQLQPVEFDWRARDFPAKGFGERRSFGLIAQDVEKLFPELVVTDAEGYKAVNYSRLPLVLLQAFKEEHARREEERTRNDRLEERLAELERMLARVK